MKKNNPFVITIDGPAAAGKGTLMRGLAEKLGYRKLDSGRLYRSVAKHAEDVWGLKVPEQIEQIALSISQRLPLTEEYIVEIDQDMELDEDRIARLASLLASEKIVRKALRKQQIEHITSQAQGRVNGSGRGIVLDGRDMGTVVYPNAQCKIFLTASAEARAKRRYEEMLELGRKIDYKQVLEDMRARDTRDLARAQAPLKVADDAMTIDSSDKSAEIVLEIALRHASDNGARIPSTP